GDAGTRARRHPRLLLVLVTLELGRADRRDPAPRPGSQSLRADRGDRRPGAGPSDSSRDPGNQVPQGHLRARRGSELKTKETKKLSQRREARQGRQADLPAGSWHVAASVLFSARAWLGRWPVDVAVKGGGVAQVAFRRLPRGPGVGRWLVDLAAAPSYRPAPGLRGRRSC